MRDVTSGSLTLVGSITNLPGGGSSLALRDETAVVAAGSEVFRFSLATPQLPVAIDSWSAPSTVQEIALDGPWLLAQGSAKTWLLDGTGQLTMRTWAERFGSPVFATLVGGALIDVTTGQLASFAVPYPTLTSRHPEGGQSVAPTAAVTLRFDETSAPSMVPSASVDLRKGSGAAVPHSLTRSGAELRLEPTLPLELERHSVRLTIPPSSILGGGWLHPYDWSFRVSTPPSLTADAIAPTFGPISGGTVATITGTGFGAATRITIGGVEVTPSTFTSTSLTFSTPPAANAGPVLVDVGSGGTTSRVPGGFSYIAPLQLVGVTPSLLSETGGLVTLSGSGFTRGLVLRLDGTPTALSSFSPTALSFVVPPGPTGFITVRVEQPGTTGAELVGVLRRADQSPPVLVRLEPAATVGASNVDVGATLTLVFNERLNPASISNVRLAGSRTSTVVAVSRVLSADALSVSVTPAAPLLSTTEYQLTWGGLRDVVGNPAGPFDNAVFRTRDTVAPQLSLALLDGRPVTNGTQLASNVPWAVAVLATDDSGTVVSRTLQIDGVGVPSNPSGHFPYTWPLSSVGVPSTIHATATDPSGNTTSLDLTVQITNDTPPQVDVMAPQDFASFGDGETIPVNVAASDNNGLALVRLYVDGRPWKTVTTSASTATLTDSLRFVLTGGAETHTLQAEAYDSRGTRGVSPPVTLTVQPDTTAPVVAWTSPGGGAQVPRSTPLTLAVTATDANAIASVRFLVDGAVVETKSAPPWASSFTPSAAAGATLSLRAEATDRAGNTGSSTRSISVGAPSRPTVQLTNTATQPLSIASFVEGTRFTARLMLTSVGAIERVELDFGWQSRTFLRPASSTLDVPVIAPNVTPAAGFFPQPSMPTWFETVPLRVRVFDAQGEADSATAFIRVQDGTGGSSLTLTTSPEGPEVAGGSVLSATAVTDAGNLDIVATVAGQPLLRLTDGGWELPAAPEGAGIDVTATAASSNGALLSATQALSLYSFAAATTETATVTGGGILLPLEQVGDTRIVARRLAAHQTEVVSLATDGTELGRRSLAGELIGSATLGGRHFILLERAQGARLVALSLPALTASQPIDFPAQPTALTARGGFLVVGTTLGLEVRDPNGALVESVSGLAVRALSSRRGVVVVARDTGVSRFELTPSGHLVARGEVALPGPALIAATTSPAGFCAAWGGSLSCFDEAGVSRGAVGLDGLAASIDALGAWILVSTQSGSSLFEVTGAPRLLGRFVDTTGATRLSHGSLSWARGSTLFHRALLRGPAAPLVSFPVPASATAGSTLALTAAVTDEAIAGNGFTAELTLGGAVTERFDGELPTRVALPPSGASASIGLNVIDVGGNRVARLGSLSFTAPTAGPSLSALRHAVSAPGGARLVVGIESDEFPRIAATELSLDNGAPVTFAAPANSIALMLPAVAVPTTMSISAVAIDAQGRRGAPLTSSIEVMPDGLAGPLVSLSTLSPPPWVERARVTLSASIAAPVPGDSVEFLFGGQVIATVSTPPFEATVTLPAVQGTQSVSFEARGIDSSGRVGATASTSLLVVDSLNAPQLSLVVSPLGTTVANGAPLTARLTSTSTDIDLVETRILADGVEVFRGGSEAQWTVAAAPGAVLEIRGTASHTGGLQTTVSQTRRVELPVLTGLSSVAGRFVPEAGFELTEVGAFVATLSGISLFTVNQQGVSAAPAASLALGGPPTTFAVLGEQLWLARAGQVEVYSTPAFTLLHSTQLACAQLVAAEAVYCIDGYDRSRLTATSSGINIERFGTSSPIGTMSARLGLYNRFDPNAGVLFERLGPGSIQGLNPLVNLDFVGVAPFATRQMVPAGAPLGGTSPQHGVFASTASGVMTGTSAYQFWPLELGVGCGPVEVDDARGYVGCEDGVVHVIDISRVSSPAEVGVLPLEAARLRIREGQIVGLTSERLSSARLSGGRTLTAPEVLAVQDVALSIAGARDQLLVAGGTQGLLTARLRTPGDVTALAALAGASTELASQVERINGRVFVKKGSALWVLEENALGYGNQYQYLPSVERFAVTGRRMWAVAGASLMTMPSVTSGVPAPSEIEALVLPEGALDIAAEDTLAAVGGGTQVMLVETSPTGVPAIVGLVSGAGRFVALDDTILAVADVLPTQAETEPALESGPAGGWRSGCSKPPTECV